MVPINSTATVLPTNVSAPTGVIPLNSTTVVESQCPPIPRPATLQHDVAIKYVAVPAGEVYQGWPVKIIVSNVGDYVETANVTAYLDDIVIGAHATPIPPETDDRIDFVIPFEPDMRLYANYTLRVEVSPISGETVLSDNLYSCGYVIIKMTGDVNADRKIDMKDIGIAAKAFGSYPGHTRWPGPSVDLNCDFKVDMKDMGAIAKQFGKIHP